MKTIRSAVPFVAGALFVAGCGGSETPATQTASAQQRPAGGGFLSGDNLTKLASTLGVSKTKLQSALTSIMPQGGPPGGGQGTPPDGGQGGPPPGGGNGAPPAGGPTGARGPGGPGGGQLAGQLAKKLGLPEAKVTKALASILPQRPGS